MLRGYQCLADSCGELFLLTKHVDDTDLFCPYCVGDVVDQGEYQVGQIGGADDGAAADRAEK